MLRQYKSFHNHSRHNLNIVILFSHNQLAISVLSTTEYTIKEKISMQTKSVKKQFIFTFVTYLFWRQLEVIYYCPEELYINYTAIELLDIYNAEFISALC